MNAGRDINVLRLSDCNLTLGAMPSQTLHEAQAKAAAIAEALFATSHITSPAVWEQDDALFSSDDDDLEDWMLTEGNAGFSVEQ